MKRREFITLVGGVVATWPLAVRAQHSAMPVIGFMGPAPAATYLPRLEALRAGLRDLGYVEGKNIACDEAYELDLQARAAGIVALVAVQALGIVA
jgi:putative ABC transport system substrate-binding protein